MDTGRRLRTWPIFVIALPAAVSIWGGWVSLGQLCGFGSLEPFPGLLPLHINTAMTLPVGVEAYASFALAAWLHAGRVPERARRFAKYSSIGALLLGGLGQICWHVLSAEHAHRAPTPVVVLVATLPVITLGFGTGLAHLMRSSEVKDVPEPTIPVIPPVPAPVPQPALIPAPMQPVRTRTPKPERTRGAPVTTHMAEYEFRHAIAAGSVPSIRDIKDRLNVGQAKATELQKHLATLSA